MTRRLIVCAVLFLNAAIAAAQQPANAIPTPEQFLGYQIGERFTPYARILDYFNELAKRSDLITVQQFGETYEHRPLVMAIVTSAKNRAAIDDIRTRTALLGNGQADANRIADIAKSTPAVVWLGFGIHGNESSSAEAAMMVASTLLHDAAYQKVLDDTVVIIDPLENPDGRERYIEWYRRTRGMKANPSPQSFEHQEPWPGGRFNHYLIDMNRDWAWMTQRETQARIAQYRLWFPQVFVDFHEMGSNSTYFFPPDAKPINANLPSEVEHWLEVFGKANAAEFSKRGWPFFVAESFDLFYPGYGDSWPSLHGAIGMTYEVAGGGRAGTAVEREDKTILTLADRALRHYTTALATVRTAAQNREALLRYTAENARHNIESGKNTYLLLPDSPNFGSLVSLLQRQGIRVDVLTSPMTIRATHVENDAAESKSFPAGTAVVSTKQAAGGLANTLLERQAVFTKGYVEQQRVRAQADEPDEFYDITSWSLPIAMNVDAYVTTTAVTGGSEYQAPAATAFHPAAYGYLVDGLDPQLYRFAGRLLDADVKFSVADADLPIGDRTYSRGTLVVLKGNNAQTVDAALERAVRETGVTVTSLESGWMGGTALGSEKIRFVKQPGIGLVGGAGSDPTSYGMLWHTLDVDTAIPHSTLSSESLRNIDLKDYSVIVFPDGNYSDRIGKRGMEKLKQWVSDGGTLVAVKGGASFLREKDFEMSKLKPWEAPKKKDDDKATTPEEHYNDFRVPGAAFRTTMNDRSYLTFGVPRSPDVIVEGSGAFLPLPHKVDNIVTINAKDALASGVAWTESLDRVSGSVYMAREPFGNGQVITFADDPNYRGFWRGTLPLFLNAVLYSASYTR